MKLLFIGGNGNISWYCVQKALENNHEVWELNRSQTLMTRRKIQEEVHKVTCDIHNLELVKEKLEDAYFDVIFDFICYNEKDAEERIRLFFNKTNNYVFISSDAMYKRIENGQPFYEESEKYDINIEEKYIVGKILAEQVFIREKNNNGFPVTIVRPSYTYDTIIPVSIGHNCFTAVQKYIDGLPALIAGNGTNVWSFTHSSDFAEAIIPLVENKDSIGEVFNIATDELISWNDEMEILFKKLGISHYESIHIPYKDALKIEDFQSSIMMRHKMSNNIIDTFKLKQYVPNWKAQVSLEEGISNTIKWLMEDKVRRRFIESNSVKLYRIYEKYKRRVI